jgi:hypothetical protein
MTVGIQRIENIALAVAVVAGFVVAGFDWWWLLALFIAFDLSMVGYAISPSLGAWTYNVVHNYVGPSLVLTLAVITDERAWVFLALVWAFHIAVDRALGYGLKFTDRFTHTHLGEVGRRA